MTTAAHVSGRWGSRGAHPVLAFVIKRLAFGVLTLLVVSILIFVGTSVLPGDAARAFLGRTRPPRQSQHCAPRSGCTVPSRLSIGTG